MYGVPFGLYTDNNPLIYVLTTAKLNVTGLRWVADLANFKFKIYYRSGIKSKNADYLFRHLLHEIEQFQKDSDMVINSDNISLCNSITSAYNNSHIDINVLQLNSVDNITSVRTEEVIESQVNDDCIEPVYQSITIKTKPSKQEWKEISYQSKLLMEQYHKLKLVKNVLIRSTSDYNQIVLTSSMQDLYYTELNKIMRHLGTEKVVDLAKVILARNI